MNDKHNHEDLTLPDGPHGQATRGAAVIVASKPLARGEMVEELAGRQKQVLPAMIRADGMTFIERLIIRFQHVGLAPIIVITGFENEKLERHLARTGVVCLNNPHWEDSSSLDDAMMGLLYAERSCPACEKILLATPLIPSVKTETLTALLASSQAIALPVYQGEEGLPLAIHRNAVKELTGKQAGGSMADLVTSTSERIDLDDLGILSQIENWEDKQEQALEIGLDRRLPMRARLKLSLARDSIFFGPGPATLLRLIDETGSVRTACTRMKLSYSKGWQLLNLLEEELGRAVIDRQPGGQEGGSSRLTETGRDLLHRYEQLTSESQRQVNLLFDSLFADFPEQKR